ncbi:MAG: RagB/SusD family nutrient uptake outer membrane protein [Bacteroidales bacterium]|nr:RagB/SusD family nutrient uptake outer membrane protein [Bacteroidales bacterium]
MKKTILITLSVVAALVFTGCNSDFLDRSSKVTMTDNADYWTKATNVRLFVDGAYNQYFTGYNSGWSGTKTPTCFNRNECSDDISTGSAQYDILLTNPNDNWYRSEGIRFLVRRGGTGWDFSWIRKWNTLIERLEQYKDSYTSEEFNHWMGVARFFRAYEYSTIVQSFGDVPYYDHVLSNDEYDEQYKDRDPRTTVMQKCMEDFDFAMANIRTNDGTDYVNRYVAATMASRCMLFEGTWYIYHKNDPAMKTCSNVDALAKTFLEKARDYAQIVIDSGKYGFTTEFNALFGTYKGRPAGNEILLYRSYSNDLAIRHCIASYCNMREGQSGVANLSTLKAWICNDGQPYTTSTVDKADSFEMHDLVASRDPRFEATFYRTATSMNATGIYTVKFIDREGPDLWSDNTNTGRPEFRSNTNINGYPCVRYAETVLNWIEAKAELADKFGGAAVTQADLDKSINAIRNRPIADAAVARGVKKTAPLQLGNLPNDPARTSALEAGTHAGIVNSPLIWEIRRERRMEFFAENFRTLDIRRWGKLELMQGANNPDILLGCWVKLSDVVSPADPLERPFNVTAADANANSLLRVQKADGTIIAYTGSNLDEMEGFLVPKNVRDRGNIGGVKQYLEPICRDVINDYANKSKEGKEYKITQNPGWEE